MNAKRENLKILKCKHPLPFSVYVQGSDHIHTIGNKILHLFQKICVVFLYFTNISFTNNICAICNKFLG